ncbi:hypothetical protein PR202_gb29744 [Eleusine coracana subsp. coracana]|uniref:DUF6598 domain-containing protein n=1 Tax=Eleusine coracana subsp. coracana TaxID=191504 RepID=A0AAV5G0T7_ELECO|nr:hypothetical protein PR202_gb29744 [Eleusine coracana subsp. coracana]
MEIEGGGSKSAEIFDPARGKKRPPSPPTPGDEFDSPTSTARDVRDEWLLSDSGGEEYEENRETHRPFTVADFPRADYDKQWDLLYLNPEIKLRGPPAIMLFPPFKTGKHAFGSDYNLADKSELTVREIGDCSNECRCLPMDLLQFVSVKIAGYQHTHSGPAKISGFVAARDTIEPFRNYVYRRKINNCEAVNVKSKTGVGRLSLISPARVISFSSRVLIEFELHGHSDEETDGDNGPIIEGCTELYNMFALESFMEHKRLYGERSSTLVPFLVVNMKVCAKTSNFNEVICLFQGAAPDPDDTMNFVVAAERRKGIHLYIEGSARDGPILGQKPLRFSWWWYSFPAGYHAVDDTVVAKLGEFATVSVKVTWRTHMKKALRV